jgi:hypothetical protein
MSAKTETFPKPGGRSQQRFDTQQQIGKDQFVPKGRGGVPNPAETGGGAHVERVGNSKAGVTLSTAKHQAKRRGPFVKTSGAAQTSSERKTGQYSKPKLGTEERKPKDYFVPTNKPSAA